MGEAEASSVSRGEGRGRCQTGLHRCKGATYSATARTSPMSHAGVGLVKRAERLATTGRGHGRWNGGQMEVAQDAGQHRLLSDGSKDAQGATAAKRTGCHSQSKHATQLSGPVPIRCCRLRCIAVDTLLARCGNDRRPALARRRQAAGRADKVRTRQGHKRRTLLQKLQRREFHAGGPSDQGLLKRSMRSPCASCSSRANDTAPLAVERIKHSN